MAGLSESKRKLLERRLRGGSRRAGPRQGSIPARDPSGPPLASLGQHGIYAAHQADPESPSFNVTSSFEVVGELDVDRLQRSVDHIVARHDVLRSRYRLVGDVVHYEIRPQLSVTIERYRCAQDGGLEAAAEERVRRPFDLAGGALLRLHYLSAPSGRAVLTMAVHDIVFDKWSLGVFWGEVAAHYRCAHGGAGVALPSRALQFADFAAWQRQRMVPDGLARQLDYWRTQLEGAPAPIDLPTDRAYPARLSDGGRLERGRLRPELTAELKALAAGENATLFMLLLLAYQLLVHRYSGADDIVVAAPVANRRSPELAEVIGFFLSTVPVRLRVNEDETVRQALGRVRTTALEALDHQDAPFDRIVEAVRPPRVPGRHPLCQLMFVYQREHEGAPSFDLGDVELRHIYVETRTSKYDVTLFTAESGDGLETILEYRTDLFDPATMRRMLAHYEQLLESIVANPDARIGELELLTRDERRRLLSEWQGEPLPLDGVAPIVEQIDARAAATPDAPAVITSDGELVYGELDAIAGVVASRLTGLGVQPGQCVAHLMERSAASIAAIVGILRAGAAYVPIDPEYPEERRAFVVRDASIEVAVTSRAQQASIAASVEATVVVEERPPALGAATAVERRSVAPESPAYSIYTSGSTGTPKGVVVSHANLLHSTAARDRFYGEPPARFLLIPSYSFDSSVAGLFWTLAAGGALVVASAEEQRDPAELCRLIRQHAVTDLLCIPSLYREIVTIAAADGGALPSLRRAIVAGEACPPDLVVQHEAELAETALFNEYGPTEATVWATVERCRRVESDRAVPIGRPIANTSVFLLDRARRPVPVGVPGEICIGGGGVALGYAGREELTRERFPTVALPGDERPRRVYATGDLGRWRADGRIDFLGRLDDQVKLRGYRIELGEVEAALVEQPRVAAAAAATFGRGTDSSPRRLIAYVTPQTLDEAPDPTELKDRLRRRLPAYAVPQAVVVLAVLPRLPNGKVDRGALPEPETRSPRLAVEPSSRVEAELLRVWSEVLGVESLSVEDDFFGLGGDSLMSIQIVSRARLAGLVLTPRDLADYPTVAALAERVRTVDAAQERDRAEVDAGPIPLTPIQRWFFDRELACPERWGSGVAIEVDPSVDDAGIARAFAAVAARHRQLRAGFVRQADGWTQAVGDATRVPVETFELAAASIEAALEAAVRRLQEEFRFDGRPLAGAAVVRAGGVRRLVVVAHHLLIDQVSWHVLLDDLALASAALSGSDGSAAGPEALAESALPPATDSFARYAHRLAATDAASEADYWAAAEVESLGRLPLDLVPAASGAPTEGDAATVEVALEGEMADALFGPALAAYNNSVEDLLVVALARSLAAWTGAGSLRVGLERHGRDLFDRVPGFDVSRTVGWFTSAFPLRVTIDPRGELAPTIKAIKEMLREIPRSGVGYGQLRYGDDDELRRRVGADEEAEDVLFNYLGRVPDAAGRGGAVLAAEPLFAGTRAAENARSHPLEINAYRSSGLLRMIWTYSRRAHDGATIERWGREYLTELEEIVRHCASGDVAGYTPSDFPDAGMSQQELDDFLDQR